MGRFSTSFFCLLLILGLFPEAAQGQKRLRKKDALNVTVELENLTSLNTPDIEFSPAFYANGMVFVSSRKKHGPVDKEIGETYFELYYAELDPNGLPLKPEPFSININSQYHEGPVAFNREGTKLLFSRNNSSRGNSKADSKGKTGLKIYEADRGYFDWENVRELPFNSDEYTCMHPTLSSDGKTLYFSSNMPGGQGGYDIWVVKKIGGSWSPPINMGSRINTPNTEAFPFAHESGTLFFASDGHKGYGGLDLFMIDIGSSNWGEVINLGGPFNSDADDLGIILNPDGDVGYFTSNRPGGFGKDDLYMFDAPQGIQGVEFPTLANVVITAFDEQSGRKIPGVSVRIYEDGGTDDKAEELYDLELSPTQSGEETMVFKRVRKQEEDLGDPKHITNASGEAYALFNNAKTYTLLLSKNGFLTREVPYNPAENIYNRPIEVGLSPSNCVTLSGLVASTPYNKPIPNAFVTILNHCTGEETSLRTNINGTFESCIELGCKFTITSQRDGYASDSSTISTEKIRGQRSFAVVLEMAPQSESVLSEPIKEGSVIILQNIHYDFGKSSIRSGEAKDLESLTDLMKAYPSMEIELISHTDCRGGEQFNLELSLDRAESAKKFLVNRGIEESRIKAFGYGEAYPINECNCKNEENECEEEAYEANRRTEVRIARINESVTFDNK
jgi:outer membrane protein OmpA-like peptidoglycan-associated protein/Tol biopolymer transport system component